MKRALPFALLLSLSTAASATWVDKFGRVTELSFPGTTPVTIGAASHSLADGVAAFDQICLKTNFDRNGVEKAVAASDWGFSFRSEMVPFKEPVDVGGWNTPDAAVRMANAIFFNKKSQCNLTFAPNETVSSNAVLDAVSNVLRQAPSNAAKRFDKKGNPAKYFSPEWTLVGSDGAAITVFAHASRNISGAIHLAAIKN